jgi:prepilin-type processing-associated H-X9-DG protein
VARAATAVVAIAALLCAGFTLVRIEVRESARTECLSNERRLSTALLLYSQDHDGRLPPPDYPDPGLGSAGWRDWVGILQPYSTTEHIAECPANGAGGAKEARHGYAFPYSYALNERFYGVFGPGPFPLENLEIAAQTVLVAEGGEFTGGRPATTADGKWSVSIYTDTAEWPWAYRSPHDGRMNVAAADGHVTTLKLAHYTRAGHNALYGRLGGSIYNWNGGHPNGYTGGAPRE